MERVKAYLGKICLICVICAGMVMGLLPVAVSAQAQVDWDAAMAAPAASVWAYANRLLIKTADSRLLLCQTDTRSCRQYTPPTQTQLSLSSEYVSARDAQGSYLLDEQSGEWKAVNLLLDASQRVASPQILGARSQNRWSGGYGYLFSEYYSLWYSGENRGINLSLTSIPTRITMAAPSWDGRCVWFLVGNQLAKTAVPTRRSAILLPWNRPGILLKAIAPAPSGVWVATNFGTLLLNNAEDHPVFVKAIVDSPLDVRMSSTQERFLALVEKWQGTPYQWGAQSCQVSADCSGFVTGVYYELGISLPRSSQAIGQWSGAQTVTDELRIGDMLVMPGHVALYMGNGLTTETRTSIGVAWGSVYGRSNVMVKRVLLKESGEGR